VNPSENDEVVSEPDYVDEATSDNQTEINSALPSNT